MNSELSTASSKHDPDLLRSEIQEAKRRVSALKQERDQARFELAHRLVGYEALAKIEEKFTKRTVYTPTEILQLSEELGRVKQSLRDGERERMELLMVLIKNIYIYFRLCQA